MKRHPALVRLSRDHHHGLVEAQRLKRSASADEAGRRRAAERFVAFFAGETLAHFREEEEVVFPLLLRWSPAPPQPLTRALLEHGRLHELVDRLRRGVEDGGVGSDDLLATAMLLEAHIRAEERELFPLIERLLPEEELRRLAADPGPGEGEPGPAHRRSGPIWGAASEDLNATLLSWDAGEGVPEHVDDERDVLVVVLAGSATIEIDGIPHRQEAGGAVLIEKGRSREIVAGPDGVRYVSAHLRRTGLGLEAPPPGRARREHDSTP